MQFIASFRDVDCGNYQKSAVPGTMFWIQNDVLYTKLRFGNPCIDKGNIKEYKIGRVVPGKWHTIVFQVEWKKTETGFFKVWFDKDLRVDEKSVSTFFQTDHRLLEFRVGLYPNWYTWDGSGHPFIPSEVNPHREIVIDSVGMGPRFEDADPWNGEAVRDVDANSEKNVGENKLNANSPKNLRTYKNHNHNNNQDCIGFGCN